LLTTAQSYITFTKYPVLHDIGCSIVGRAMKTIS